MVKAIQIMSTFELAERYFVRDAIVIESSQDVLREVREYRDRKQEYLISLTLDGANRLIKMRVITIGLIDQSLIHPREVFASAIEDRANSIILAHNHPSGIPNPSSADITITNKLQKAGDILGIKLIDHIIVTKSEYFSFREGELL
jgi:DNA repair protein RadC